jgi:aspartate oxidase
MTKKYIWQLRSSMMRNLGILRNESSILRGLTEIVKIERESQGLSAKLNDMILVSKFIIIGAYKRMESRGCHLRSDFLESKKEFLTHIDQNHSNLEKDIQCILKNKDILKKEDSLAS